MYRFLFSILMGFFSLVAVGQAHAFEEKNFSAGLKLALPRGIGIEGSYRLSPVFSLRADVVGFGLSRSAHVEAVKFKADLRLLTGGLFIDARPFSSVQNLKLVGGLLYNGNRYKLSVTPTSSISLGGIDYTPAAIGDLNTQIDFNKIAPYLGVGYSVNLSDSLDLLLDAGVLFQGTPKVKTKLTGGLKQTVSEDDISNAIKKEINKPLLRFMPVASISLVYRF